jgi:hypothetical protein
MCRFIFCLPAMVFLLSGCSTYPVSGLANPPSEEMKSIITSLKGDQPDLSRFSKVKDNEEQTTIKAVADIPNVEWYELPKGSGADASTYVIYYDRADGRYWIFHGGGAAWVAELYGPIKFPPILK